MEERIIKINKKLIEGLAEEYAKSQEAAFVVAAICDEVLDKSGRLLGEVRIVARQLLSQLK